MLMSRNQCHFCSSYPYPQAGKIVGADAYQIPIRSLFHTGGHPSAAHHHIKGLSAVHPTLTLPTSKEGGFLLQRSPPGRGPGLTQSPQAYRFGCVPPYQLISYDSKRRPSFRMFFAAFKSTSWIAPQQGHSHCSLKRLLNALFRYPQTLQTCVLGNKASICTNGLCCHAHL